MHRLARLTTLMIASLVVVSGSLGQPSVALARRGQPIVDPQSIQLVLTSSATTIEVCQDEIKSFNVTATESYDYRYSTDSLNTRRHGSREPHAPIRLVASSNAPNVATVSPPIADLSAPDFTATLEITGGDRVGTTSIVVKDTPLTDAIDIQVQTGECNIKISSTSIWNLNFNYPLTAYGTMAQTTLHRTSPGIYMGQGTLTGQASGDPFQGAQRCSARHDVGNSTVTITATLRGGAAGQFFDVQLTYTRVSATTTAQCPTPVGPIVKVAKGKSKPLDMLLPNVRAFKRSALMIPKFHEISTDYGLKPGNTQYVLETTGVHP